MSCPSTPASQDATEIIVTFGRPRLAFLVGEPIVRIKHIIPEVVEHAAMESVGTRSGCKHHLAARLPPKLWSKGGRLDAELLQIVHRYQAACTTGGTKGRRRPVPELPSPAETPKFADTPSTEKLLESVRCPAMLN